MELGKIVENKPTANKLPSYQAVSFILTFCAISALFIYLIYSKNIIFGSDAEGFSYAYFETVKSMPRWILLAVFLLTGVLIYGGSKLIQKYEKATLIGCLIIAIAIQILMQKIYPYSLEQNITSVDSNSFYTAAWQYSAGNFLSNFLALVPTLPEHARTNMPGKILFFQFLELFTTSPKVMGYLIISISTLGGLLLYGICKRLFQDRTAALYSFVLYTLIPCKQVFFPILNTITPVFILVSLYLFVVYLDSRNRLYLILLGISLFGLALFEPSPFVTGILFLGVLYHALEKKKVTSKDLIWIVLIPTLSFLAIHLLLFAFLSFDVFRALQYVFKDAATFNTHVGRSYSFWLRENLIEFFYGAGLPILMIFIYFASCLVGQWKWMLKNFLHWSIENIYVLSLALTFGIVLFIGINRAETTRLWIYLAVFFQVPTAYFVAKEIRSNTLFFILAGTLILQTAVTLQRVGFVLP